MPRLRVPSLKIRQNAENVTLSGTSGTPKRGRGGRRRGSSSRRGGRKSKPRNAPWEEDEEIEQNYGYESRSEEEEEDEEDDEDFLAGDVEQPDVSEPESDLHELGETEENIKMDPDSSSVICPWLEEDAGYPILELPDSSSDIPVHADLVMDMIELYEIIRSYHRTLRLTAFSFEDFCAAMSSSENSCLLSEIHMSLLKICLKSDDEDQIHYSVNDTNNAFNIMVYCMDSMTYAEVLRQYLESDKNRLRVPIEILKAVNEPNYPFVDISIRVAVIAFLCYRFLDSTEYRKVLSNAGRFVNDDLCRVCGKGGIVQGCHNCDSSFHFSCVGLTEKQDEYHCDLCKLNEVRGATDALPFEHLKSKQPLRMESLGRDRHGRIYWFVVRRLIIQDENESELFYYSTLPQLYEVFSRMDPHFLEYNLCKTFCEQLQEIAEQMSVTLELSIERFEYISNKDIYKDNNLTCFLHLDNVSRMKHILLNLWENSKVKSELVDEFEYQPLPDRLLPLMGVVENHLNNSFWSGYYPEQHVVKLDVTPFLEAKDYFLMGECKYDDFFRKYRNHYNGNEYSETPAFRKKILDKKKYLSTRFSIIDEGSEGAFSWSIARGRDMYGNDRLQAKYIEWTLARMMKKIPTSMMHQRWGEAIMEFRNLLAKADDYTLLSQCLLMMECCMRRTLFLPQFWSSLGHTRLTRTTVDERDQQSKEMQRKKKEERDLTMGGDDDDDSIIRVKYTRTSSKTCPQSLWRQRDEVYRVAGKGSLGGWMWVSRGFARDIRPVPKYQITDEMDSTERTLLETKIGRLKGLADKLLKWRSNEEAAKETNNICYSPSCRMGLVSASVTSNDLDITQLCYSSTCRATYLRYRVLHSEDFKNTNTVEPAKAFKKAVVPCGPEKEPETNFKWPLLRPNKFTYRTSKRKSVLIIADNILRKLAKTGGRKAFYIPNFSLSAKSNMTLWNYPCSRPCFDLCWRYLVTNARSLHAVALQMKILWYCVKWPEFEPGEEETDAGRLIVHQMDRDDIRTIVDHQELPPHGTYERYLLEIEALMLEDDVRDDDDDYSDRADRRVSRGSASRPKRSNTRTSVRRIKETTRQWIDGVELKVFEIKKYWEKKIKAISEKQDHVEKVSLAKERIIQHKAMINAMTPRVHVGLRSPVFTPGSLNMKSMPRPYPIPHERWKRVHTPQTSDYVYDDHDQNMDDDPRPSFAKRARIVFTTQDSPGSPNRRIANGYEYNGGMLIGGGRMIGQPVGDGMRRVTMSNGTSPQIGAEEVLTSSGQNSRVLRAAGGVDTPPSIERFDSPGSGYTSGVGSRTQPRQVVYSQQTIQRQSQNGKVLMIRRSDGSTQFLRPVNSKDGESSSSSGGPVIRTVVNQPNASTSSEQNANTPGSVQRRIITTARTTMVRPGEGATKVLRIGQNGQQVLTSKPRVVSRIESGEDQFVKRVSLEKPAVGNSGVMSVQPNVQLVRRVNRPVPIRTDQGYYGENSSVDEYTQMADQGIRPPGRPPARVTQAYGYSRPVQRIISRNAAGVPVGQVMAVSSSSTNEDDFASYEEGYVNGYRGSLQVSNRRITSYKEFCMKRGIVDNMRLPSRPYRFEFESNEDEERAIAEAIAREEELMRQEEESKRGQSRNEHHWQHPRIINQYGQVGTNLFSQLSKQPLNYSSNLMPSKDDSPEQKSIKQMLDTIITQVCRWDKQHGWYKSHLKRPRNRFELDKLRSRRMFSNQREVMLAQHVDRLRKEINKRRTALENQAEEESGLLTPWRKSKGRGQKVTKRQNSPEPEAPRQVVNPAEISLGGDAVKWNEPRSIKKEEILDENFLQDVDVENLIEVQSPQRRTERRSTNRWSPQPPKSPKKMEKLRKVKEESHSAEETQSIASPRRRGRPPKRPFDNNDGASDDSDGGGRKKVRRPPPCGLDINALHCLCQKRYNPFRFYLACNICSHWYHGKCVGICEDDIDNLTSWTCPRCDIPKQVPLYCKCQTEYNESEFYVGCDGCQGWFHPNCVGITREIVEKISEYLCPDCSLARDNAEESRQDDDYDSADSECNSKTPLNRSDYPILWKLYELLFDHRMAWPFRQPTSDEEYPEYSKIVMKPIDLSVIQRQLENLEYHTLDEYADDVRLMFQNAKTYFKEGTVALCADSLEKLFETQLADTQNQIETRRMQDRRKASESRTIDSSLDIDTDQLMDVLVDPSMYEQLL